MLVTAPSERRPRTKGSQKVHPSRSPENHTIVTVATPSHPPPLYNDGPPLDEPTKT